MATVEWRAWCAVPDCRLVDGEIEVRVGGGRKHRVEVVEDGSALRLTGLVVSGRRATFEDLELETWQRNRRMMLVGFRFESRDRLVGECWVPVAGLTKDEFLLCLRTLARECDRFEYQLTGEDRV